MELLKLDLGCGAKKKPGTIGVDYFSAPGVDVVLNLEHDRLPYDDGTVGYIHSSHFLEHLTSPAHLFKEISRVCADGAELELWTPYVWHDNGFILEHTNFYQEETYLHLTVRFPEVWWPSLNAAWLLRELVYIVEPATLVRLHQQQIPIDFALRHLKGIAGEFAAMMTIRRNYSEQQPIEPQRSFAFNRDGQRFLLSSPLASSFDGEAFQAACQWHQLTPAPEVKNIAPLAPHPGQSTPPTLTTPTTPISPELSSAPLTPIKQLF